MRVSDGEEWAVVGVYNRGWRVTEANVTQNENAVILDLTLKGSAAGQEVVSQTPPLLKLEVTELPLVMLESKAPSPTPSACVQRRRVVF